MKTRINSQVSKIRHFVVLLLLSVVIISSYCTIFDVINQVFASRTIIHWINLCSAITCLLLLYHKISANLIFYISILLSTHQYYFLERLIAKPHYEIFPDTQSYINNANEFLVNPKNFLIFEDISDLGFTLVIALFSTLSENIDILNYFILLLNICLLFFAFSMSMSVVTLRPEAARIVSTIFVFFPGVQFFPAFMLKECILCFLISGTFYLYFKLNIKYFSHIFNLSTILFRPAYTLIISFSLIAQTKLFLLVIFLVSGLVIFGLENPLVKWFTAVLLGQINDLDLQSFIENAVLAFLFPLPDLQRDGVFLSAVYSYGVMVFYTLLPFYILLVFQKKTFPAEYKAIFLIISTLMLMLGLGLFRAKVVLLPIYVVWLSAIFTRDNGSQNLRGAFGLMILFAISLMLMISNFK